MSSKYVKVFFFFAAMLLVALPVLAAMEASEPVSDGGVTPYIIDGANQGGNRTCEEVGLAFYDDADYYEFSSERVNYEGGVFDAAFPGGLTVNTDGTYVSFSSTFGIGAVIVKGSAAANVYEYNPPTYGDSGLAAPVNPSNGSAGLSNITFCWNPGATPQQWCSPGYWRQEHHYDSWPAGFDKSSKYIAYYSADTLKRGAPSDPTLWEVLQSPQTYGGPAFNNVGDLLSGAHPDVNFNGERIEDSCPLN